MGPETVERNIKTLAEANQRHEDEITDLKDQLMVMSAKVADISALLVKVREKQALRDIMDMGSGPTGG